MSYLTIKSKATSEYTEKHSKFLGAAFPCQTEQEAIAILNGIKKEHWDARHNCYAIITDNGKTARFSDDGEPHSTAGKPILEVISGKRLVNVLVVVTRYFGGILLGTGGLVRAYTTAAKQALEDADIVEMVECTEFKITCSYSEHPTLQRLVENSHARHNSTDFGENVTIYISLKNEHIADFNRTLSEAFAGKIKTEETAKTVSSFEV